MKIRKVKNYKGFSLIESLVGVFIAAGVFVVFLAILPKIIQTEKKAQQTLIATNLAQEGIEMIRNLRDNNLKVANSACGAFEYDSVKGCNFPPNGTYTNANMATYFPAGSNYYLIPATGFTYFSRSIVISSPTADSRTITSTVYRNGTTTKIAEIQSVLYAWGDK